MKIEDFKDAPEDVRTALTPILSNEKVVAALTAFVEGSKQPLVAKRDELLGINKNLKTLIDSVGGEESIKTLKQQKEDAEAAAKKALEESTDVTAVRSALASQIKERDDAISKLQTEKKDAKVRSTVRKALSEAGGDSDLLMPHINSRVTSEIVEGEVVITVLKDGKPWFVGTDAKPATVKDLVTDMKKDATFSKAFAPSGAQGSGAKNGSGGKAIVNPWAKDTVNLTKQGEIMRNDPALAATLKAAAGK
jgi:hypothetical protein